MSLADPGQPYSCEQWQAVSSEDSPLIIDQNQAGNFNSTPYINLYHDSWGGATPTFALIDHTMTIRAKPWTLTNNTNTNQCDGTSNTIDGWSGGNTSNFLQQLVDECGDLCINGGCTTAAGDLNEDEILNIQDIITMVNQILGSTSLEGCALEAADINLDGIINIQDLISLVNAILGSSRSAQLDGSGEVKYMNSAQDMIIHVNSDVDIAGIQISLISDTQIDIQLKDNSHINQASHFTNGIMRYLAYSMFNQPFDSREAEILIKSANNLKMDDIEIMVVDINGDDLYLSHSQGGKNAQTGPHRFNISKVYPNPFNPSTQVNFSLPNDSHVQLAAYDIQGKEVDIIYEGAQSIGEHSYTWNASSFPSGVYYIRLQAGTMVTGKKVLLIK